MVYVKSMLIILLSVALWACSSNPSHTSEGAKRGATSGALGGAVGGLVSGIVFGGDPLTRAAQGAAIGAASGAAVGAASGAQRDKKEKATLATELGEKNYQGLQALADCKYEEALQLAKQGQRYKDRHHALAGYWLEAISYADQGNYEQAEALYPVLEKQDPDILDHNDAERELRDTVRKLRNLRFDYGREPQCPASA